MTSNLSLRYGATGAAGVEMTVQPTNQPHYIKQNEINLINNQQMNQNMMQMPSNIYKRSIATQGPVYQKVCKSPVVTHLVKSKHVTKATPQSTSVPVQSLPTVYSPYSPYSNNIPYQHHYYSQQQPQPIINYQVASNSYYDESRHQDVSYSFHDMNQVLSKLPLTSNESQLSPAYSTSFNYSSSIPHYQHYYPQQQPQYNIGQNTSISKLSNTVISDIENVNSSLLFHQGLNRETNLNSDSFLSQDSEMKEIITNNNENQQDIQQASSNQNIERRLPPPPYPGKLSENKTPDTIHENSNVQPATTSTGNKNQAMYIRTCSPQAFKFFMEQHIENVFKHRKAREYRRMQLENEMLKATLPDELQEQMRKLLCQKETNYIRLKRAKMNILMFETIKLLGNGAFGEVNLVRKIDTGRLYAMKTLHKTDVFNRNQAAHVKAERDILAEADNEWVVKLYYSFQDEQNLYFVMDYIPGTKRFIFCSS